MKNSYNQISDMLLRLYGAGILKYDETFIIKTLQKRVRDAKMSSVITYLENIDHNNPDFNDFTDTLQINYSEFFRNPLTFAVLESITLPSLIANSIKNKKKGIRVWSAACAKGQEVYSLAILLEELKSVRSEKFNVMLLATDLNENNISLALQGRYLKESLGNVSLGRTEKWFRREGNYFIINPELKKQVDFSVFDLLDERSSSPPAGIFGNFDLIFCANILFYYKETYRKFIVEKLADCLSPGGYLVTGETERDIIKNCNFIEVFPNSAIFQKKSAP